MFDAALTQAQNMARKVGGDLGRHGSSVSSFS
jgi:hypothetical protein